MWARAGVVTAECPVSFITAESETLLEEHHVWRMGGRVDLRTHSAKTVEAFTVLESQIAQEKSHGNR
ncbi:MAG: hypothetical protein FJW30_24740 [Acidobacteria bacterium]|nr:hypothetical protein [Acidobacteriota bacterium]